MRGDWWVRFPSTPVVLIAPLRGDKVRVVAAPFRGTAEAGLCQKDHPRNAPATTAVTSSMGFAFQKAKNNRGRSLERFYTITKDLQDQRKGRQCRLLDSQLQKIRKRLREGARPEDGVCSLRGRDIQHILEKEFHVRYCRSSVYYFLHHQLGMSYLKPRPLHRKTDPEAQAVFKKTSQKSCKKSGKRIRSDALRSGSRTKVGSASKDH